MNSYEPQAIYTVGHVAESLECSIDTVRRYSSEFADFLSEEARPGQGTRLFTDQDVLYLQEARRLLRSGCTYGQARTQLTTYEPPMQSMGTEAEDLGTAPLAALATVEQMGASLERVATTLESLTSRLDAPQSTEDTDALRSLLEAQERRLERLEAENEDLRRRIGTPLLWLLLGAFLVAVIGAGIAISLIAFAGA